jgi:biopolymer transport protein ExbD
MAEKRRFLDVWIVESNTVYREVPFTVVADWVQQGRLLEDDMLRPSGTAEWSRVGGSPDFAPYLPRAEPFRAEDQAEALEPVQLDFQWKKSREGEGDEDVDMIPLIDVSLVLLIFFMLTATGVGASAFIPTPATDHGQVVSNPEAVWVGINLEAGNTPVFSVGAGDRAPAPGDRNLPTKQELLQHLGAVLDRQGVPVEVTINAHPDVPSGLVRDITAEMERSPLREKITQKFIGVREKTP